MSRRADTFESRCPEVLGERFRNRHRAAVLLALLGLSSLSGCNAFNGMKDTWSYNGSWNNMMMGYRNDAWANKSWHSRKHHFCRERHLHEFCEGFRAGYGGVADGGDGCTPSFPPRNYWGWKYQSAEGQQKVAAWYAGYPHGARAAEEEGIGNWTQIQTSTGIQQEYATHGMLGPGQSVGMYPMPPAKPIAAELANSNMNSRKGNSEPEFILEEGAEPIPDPIPMNANQKIEKLPGTATETPVLLPVK